MQFSDVAELHLQFLVEKVQLLRLLSQFALPECCLVDVVVLEDQQFVQVIYFIVFALERLSEMA